MVDIIGGNIAHGEPGGPAMEPIAASLTDLGSTPGAVAAVLRSVQVHGRRDSTSSHNPVVRYLNRTLDIGGRLEIGAAGDRLYLYREGSCHSLELPHAVREFLVAFHRGDYPDLEQA